MGMSQNKQEWDDCLQEIEESVTPHCFRILFATLVIENSPSNAEELFEKYHVIFLRTTHIHIFNTMMKTYLEKNVGL